MLAWGRNPPLISATFPLEEVVAVSVGAGVAILDFFLFCFVLFSLFKERRKWIIRSL